MGMGSYDESEQQRLEEQKSVEDEASERISPESYEGEVSYETPDAETLLEQFKQNSQD